MINYRVYYKNLTKITAKERRVLNCLTIKSNSSMRDDVLSRRMNLIQYHIFLAKVGSKILGWAAFFPEKYCEDGDPTSTSYCAYIYVRYSHRRLGIGSRLVKKCVKKADDFAVPLKVFPWDKRSDAFFEVAKQENKKLEVECV